VTILYPDRFRQAKPAAYDGEFDWDFLLPAFRGTKVEPMDWDGVVERRSRFLVFETKPPDKDVPDGQRITLETAVKTGWFTVIVTYGKNQFEIERFEVWTLRNGAVHKKQYSGGADRLLAVTSDWFDRASKLLLHSQKPGQLPFGICQSCGQDIPGLEI
jgi:hypothetical protein